MTALGATLGALLLAGAVAGEPNAPAVPLGGSAWRMSTPRTPVRLDHRLHVYTDREDCLAGGVPVGEVEDCLPWVDATRGEIHLALGLRELDDPVPFALDPGRLRITAPAPLGPGRVAVVSHEPAGYRQLFVLLVDRSDAMYARRPDGSAPMEEVVTTLLSDAVTTTFFPRPTAREGDTGVLLLAFTDSLVGVDGRAWRDVSILTEPDAYRHGVDQLLYRSGGSNRLLDALGAVVDELLLEREVRAFVRRTQADPTVIVLTAGFHESTTGARCRDNGAKLSSLLGSLRRARVEVGRPVPVLTTVGLGRPAWHDFVLPPLLGRELDAGLLCGDEADVSVSDLTARGVDNRTLEILARVGGGGVHLGLDAPELAGFLARSAARPHRWHELVLRLGPEARQRLRRPLTLRIELLRAHAVDAELTLFPDPWLDIAPSRASAGASWGARGSALGSTGLLITGLGLSLGLLGLGIGGRHGRRAILRRARSRQGTRG